MVRRAVVLMGCLLSVLPLAAQDQRAVRGSGMSLPGRAVGTATITGTVLDAESQHPVRLAQVYLLAKTSGRPGGNTGGIRTGVDGRFIFEGVVEGDYYVLANADGYVTAAAQAVAAVAAGASQEDAMRLMPTAHVGPGGSTDVTVSVQRGGAIGGHVEWADGLPATNVPMSCESAQPPPNADMLAALSGMVSSLRRSSVDDRGAFRTSGLAPGDYIVSLSFSSGYAGGVPSTVRMYYPGVFRRSDAKPVSVRLGESRDDLRMVVDLSALHTISGTVGAATGSAQVRSGMVSLRDTTDATLRVFGQIKSDGSFAVNYVPAGTYSMTVNGSSQERSATGFRRGYDDSATNFAALTQPVTVTSTDITGMSISLNPSR